MRRSAIITGARPSSLPPEIGKGANTGPFNPQGSFNSPPGHRCSTSVPSLVVIAKVSEIAVKHGFSFTSEEGEQACESAQDNELSDFELELRVVNSASAVVDWIEQ